MRRWLALAVVVASSLLPAAPTQAASIKASDWNVQFAWAGHELKTVTWTFAGDHELLHPGTVAATWARTAHVVTVTFTTSSTYDCHAVYVGTLFDDDDTVAGTMTTDSEPTCLGNGIWLATRLGGPTTPTP